MRAREVPCPRALVDGETLESAVWDHVRDLLGSPDRLLAQFQHLANDWERDPDQGEGAEQRLHARLDSLGRADGRLLDAYQACIFRRNPPFDFGGKRPPVSVQTALPFR